MPRWTAIGPARQARASCLTRRSLLGAGFSAALLAAGRPGAGPRQVPFGAAMQFEYLEEPGYVDLFRTHCDIVLPMNELKFDQLRPDAATFAFERADRILDLAEGFGCASRGHCFVWWNALPDWLTAIADGREAERVLRRHIETVAGRYRGRLASWDVVNEVVAHEPEEGAPLRDTYWLRRLGPRHIPIAFAAAAAADPSARLVLNEYDLEFKGERYDRRRAIVLDIVRELQRANLRIDAVGLQAHLYAEMTIDKPALARFGRDLRALGVDLLVTELDVIDWNIPGGPQKQDAAAERIVGDLLDGLFAGTMPSAVIAWGLTDRHSWVPDAMPRADGQPSRPLPFDASGRPKGWYAMLEKRLREGA